MSFRCPLRGLANPWRQGLGGRSSLGVAPWRASRPQVPARVAGRRAAAGEEVGPPPYDEGERPPPSPCAQLARDLPQHARRRIGGNVEVLHRPVEEGQGG